MLNLLRVRLSNEKIRLSIALLTFKSSEGLKADFLTKSAVLPTFILFGSEFGDINTCRLPKPVLVIRTILAISALKL